MRHLIVALICIFIIIFAGALTIRSVSHYAESLNEGRRLSALHADLVASNLQRQFSGDARQNNTPRILLNEDLERAMADRATAAGRMYMVADPADRVIATAPEKIPRTGGTFDDLIASTTDPSDLRSWRSMVEITLIDGSPAFMTRRDLAPYAGTLILVQRKSDVLADWWAWANNYGFLFLTTSFVLLLTGAAFHWQSSRADDADRTLDIATGRLDKALDRARCGLWDWDIARGHIFWSKSMYDILGLEPSGELLSYGEVFKRLHPEDPCMDELVDRMLRSGDSQVDQEFRMRHKDGRWVWLRARAELAQATGEETPHFVGIAIDVTEQKHAAKLNQEAELRLRDAIENISEAFVLWDANNRLVMCNSIYQQFHNLPAGICVRGTPYDDIAKASKETIVRDRVPKDPNDTHAGNTFEVQLEDGRWLHISERRTKDGGFVSVGTDVSPIKRHERELMASKKKLMNTVRDLEKTRREQEAQKDKLSELADSYQEQKTRAEDANRSKSEFLANMSHELRTPLNAIIGFSEVMTSELLGPIGTEKYIDYARDIHGSGQYLLDVISDILDMSKIEAGRVQIEPGSCNLDAAIDHALKIIEPRAGENDIEIVRQGEADIPLFADERALKQVLINILTNAVKFTPKGGNVRIEVAAADGRLDMKIIDTGIGIPASAVEQLGRPFEQVENQLTKSHSGSGLGLAISRSLIELHGGELKISSRENHGTTVRISMPLNAREAEAAETANDSKNPDGNAEKTFNF